MLRLRKLQILGFKSFSDRTDVQFPGEGIAAIVGPNGCGKSNIADALNWVIGEQSAKTLRGGRMEDVIFSGTPARRPTGMAEVSISLIDTDVYPSMSDATPQLQIVTGPAAGIEHSDWDEGALRNQSLQETEAAIAAVQPGPENADAEKEDVENAGPEGVVLKIRRRKFDKVQRAGEVTVTRRLFRTGESEYLLNGKLCRLRDIQDLFMGTGLGPDSYALIGQERITLLLSSKPHERRSIIEEAAGVTRFKTKKRLAELRLEQSRQNLARVHDIFEEVTRQMNSLKRQASKAERHAALQGELRTRNRVVLASKLANFDRDTAETAGLLQHNATELEAKVAYVGGVESAHASDAAQRDTLDHAARVAQETATNAAIQLQRINSRRQHNQERIAELDLRAGERQSDLSRQREQHAAAAAEMEEHRAFLESATTDTAAMRGQFDSAKQHEQSCIAEVAQAEHSIEDGRRRSVQLLTEEGHLRNQQAQGQESLAAMQRDFERLTHESDRAQNELSALGVERGQVSLAFETAGEWLESLEREVSAAQASLHATRERENETKSRLDACRAEHAAIEGRSKSLDAMIREHSYSTDTVRQIFREGGAAGLETVGTLADYLEVDGQYEGVVDEFLREELNYVVVKSWDAAEEGMRLLKKDVDGRATFLVHPTDSQAKFSFAMEHEPPQHRPEDGVFRLKDKIRVLDGFGRSLEVILPKLREGYVTPDASMARNLALENPEAFFLSPTGECFHNLTVTGGRPRAEGPLALKRELREAQVRLESLASEIAQMDFTAATLKAEILELTSRVEALQTERRQAEKTHATSNASLQRVETEVSRLEARLAEWRLQLARLSETRQQREEEISARAQQVVGLESERGNMEAAVAEAQGRSEESRQRRAQAQEQASALAIRLAALEERHRGAAAQHERTSRLHQDILRRIQESEQQQAAAETEKSERRAETEMLAQEEISLTGARELASQEIARLAEESNALRARMAQQELALKELRAQADALREQRGELQAAAARLAAECEHLEAACLSEISENAAALRADESFARLEAEPLAVEETETREIRRRMDAMGPVNPMALIEYNEVAERHGFLEGQRRDLMESIDNTQAGIREIDEITRQKFDEAFARINENFGNTFTRMFGGGMAHMKLTDAENPGESGVDIVASPPGKKMQSVLLLSGGEKALTALSLLIGIFLYQPSPFCVLDEVDAPLDESNVKRFSAMLRELGATTQFIQITHSKLSMQNADQIFGVTMQEPGISKVVSVKLGGREMQARAS